MLEKDNRNGVDNVVGDDNIIAIWKGCLLMNCECKRCGYEWASRVGGGVVVPKQCPKCKQYSWGKERRAVVVVGEGKPLCEVFEPRGAP